jgi:hypothetical protein
MLKNCVCAHLGKSNIERCVGNSYYLLFSLLVFKRSIGKKNSLCSDIFLFGHKKIMKMVSKNDFFKLRLVSISIIVI